MVQKNTHIAFASSYIIGMRESQEQQIFPAVKSAQSERQVCGGWCLCVPSGGHIHSSHWSRDS